MTTNNQPSPVPTREAQEGDVPACPFCRWPHPTFERSDYSDPLWSFGCRNCGVSSESVYESEAAARSAWIAALRTPPPAEDAERREAHRLLRDLYAVVRGECPSLLNEDSGGDAELDIEIEECLAAWTAAKKEQP